MTEQQQLDTLKKKVATFLEMQKVAASKKGNWEFLKAKKALQTEIEILIAPPPPPKQAMIEWLAQ